MKTTYTPATSHSFFKRLQNVYHRFTVSSKSYFFDFQHVLSFKFYDIFVLIKLGSYGGNLQCQMIIEQKNYG